MNGELEIKQEQKTARDELIARQEFLDRFCVGWPSVYKAGCPFTDSAVDLLKWKARTERIMASDFAGYQAENSSPWQKTGPYPHFIDWTGVSAHDLLVLDLQYKPMVGMPAPVKNGSGIDPRDGQEKRYVFFLDVKDAEERAPHTDAYKSLIADEVARKKAHEAQRQVVTEANASSMRSEESEDLLPENDE